MKPIKHFASAAGIMVAAFWLTAIAGAGRTQDINAPSTKVLTWSIARSDSQKPTVSKQMNQQLVEADQALSVLQNAAWTKALDHVATHSTRTFKQISSDSILDVATISPYEATRSANFHHQQMALLIGWIAVLVTGLAILLVRHAKLARLRTAIMTADRATLAAANEQLEVALALASAKAGQLEATLAGMGDGISMVDSHLCLVEWNTQFPIIAGVPSEILCVGLPMEEILRAQVRTGQFGWIADPQAEVDRRLARLRVAPFGVVQRQRPDGHTIELRRNRLPDGGFVTLYTDVTGQKLAEEALRRAQAEAEAANAAKSRFVAIVSHEIRTPLNTLVNTMRLLGDSELAPAQQSLLAVARQSGDALDGLISDILDMSQLEAGKLSIRPSVFELRPLLEGCVDMFTGQAVERGIRFCLDIADTVPTLWVTDPARLRQVLLNLISNAVKYSFPGEIRLIVKAGVSQCDPIKLMVKDPGPIINTEARERLFQPFSRLDRPDGTDVIGTGLGLSISSQLMILLGGSIGCDSWIEGCKHQGNMFWIILPPLALPLPPAEADPQIIQPAQTLSSSMLDKLILQRPLPRTRLLLVEDVLANQLITATLLRRQGHLVDIVCSGKAAIEAAQHTPYDLIFMDIFMPDMGGQETAQIIRTLPEPACLTPIIALTANTSSADETAFKTSGMNGLLTKPVSLTELLNVLRRHVWACCSAGTTSLERTPIPRKEALLSSNRIKELRTNLSSETFANLVEECLLDLDQRLPALRQAVAEGISGAIIAQAHTMIGIAAGYGLVALEARLRSILAVARDNPLLVVEVSAAREVESVLAASAQSLRSIVHHTYV